MRTLSTITLSFFCFGLLAFATQEAVVVTESAALYEMVASKPTLLKKLSRGEKLVVSDQPQGQWYRAMVPGSTPQKIAWIPLRDIQITKRSDAKSSGKIQTKKPTQGEVLINPNSLELSYSLALMKPSNLQIAAGLNPSNTFGSLFAFEYAHLLSRSVSLGVKLEYLKVSGSLAVSDPVPGTLLYSATLMPVLATLHWRFISSPVFLMGLHLGAGVGLLSGSAFDNLTVNFVGSGLTLVVPVSLKAEVPLTASLFVPLQVGYQLCSPLSFKVSSGAAPSGFTLKTDLNAPFAGMGLGLLF